MKHFIFQKFMNNLFFILIFVLSGVLLSNERIKVFHVISFDSLTSYPTDIVGSPDGTIFILDGVNNRVLEIDQNFNTNIIIPKNESIKMSVGIGYDDGIWIADTPRNRLCKMNENGEFTNIITLDKSTFPVDLIFFKNKIYYSDKNNHEIGNINKINNKINNFSNKGNEISNLSFPGPILNYNNDYFLISDILNGRVIGSTFDLSFNFSISNFGTQIGQTYRPKGIAKDKYNNIWIADSYTGLIQIFSIDGTFIDVIKKNDTEKQFSTPTGIWIDNFSKLWVVESIINRVSVWEILYE
jgi:hypothetical protein